MFKYVLISLLILGGCGKKSTKIYIRDLINLPTDYQESVLEAIDDLNQEAGYELVILDKSERGLGWKPVSVNLISADSVDNSTLAHARYFEYHCLIQLRDDLEDQIRNNVNPSNPASVPQAKVLEGIKFTFMHELGHCYGLHHELIVSSLMSPSYSPVFWTTSSVTNLVQKLKNTNF